MDSLSSSQIFDVPNLTPDSTHQTPSITPTITPTQSPRQSPKLRKKIDVITHKKIHDREQKKQNQTDQHHDQIQTIPSISTESSAQNSSSINEISSLSNQRLIQTFLTSIEDYNLSSISKTIDNDETDVVENEEKLKVIETTIPPKWLELCKKHKKTRKRL